MANFIRQESPGFDTGKVRSKEHNSLVSYVDVESEKRLAAALNKIFPEAGFLTEEGTRQTGRSEWTWIVDPLDGTTNFVHGVPCFSISVALCHREEPVLGIVYEISHGECFYALKGAGAFLDGQPVKVSGTASLEQALVATGFPYERSTGLEPILKTVKEVLESCHGVRRFGSAAVDLAWVACGRFDAYYETTLNPWDIAAGMLLAREAGGMVSGFRPEESPFDTGKVLAATPAVYDPLLRIIQKHGL